MSEKYLHDNKHVRDLLGSPDLTQMTLLGAVEKKDAPPDLLYSLTFRQPRSEIHNILQVSGWILGGSRCLFLGKILTILRSFDPRKLEICYTGEC
jgi:hypothetical protein